MYLLFDSWIGLLEILDSTGKLAITLDGGTANPELGCKPFSGWDQTIILMD